MENNKVDILLIEDNMNDAELSIRAIRKASINNTILHLKDGAEALDFLFGSGEFEDRDLKNKPKVILLDLKMPKVDGLEVLVKIKTNKLTKGIPVVVLTSSNEPNDIDRAYSLGANSYIVKPVDFDKFEKAVTYLCIYWLVFNQDQV